MIRQGFNGGCTPSLDGIMDHGGSNFNTDIINKSMVGIHFVDQNKYDTSTIVFISMRRF